MLMQRSLLLVMLVSYAAFAVGQEKTQELVDEGLKRLEGNQQAQLSVDKRLEKIQSLETKVEELAKFRWIIAGAAILLSFAVSQSHMVVDILTPDQAPVKVETTK